jgi:hypothetical protein
MSKNDVRGKTSSRISRAAAVARFVELREVRTSSLGARLSVDLDEMMRLNCSLGVQTDPRYLFNEDQKKLLVELSAQVYLREALSEPNQEPARELAVFEANFVLVYDIVAFPPEKERETFFEAFAEINGKYNAWPYLRELVQSLSSRLGLPGLVLPVYRLPNADDANERASLPEPQLRMVGRSESP